MQRQTNKLNLFVEFGFQLFNMETLFYFKLRISAGMIDNLKTRNIALILTPFRSTEVFENVGNFVPKEMLINRRVKMPIGFTNITNSTARACKLINNACFKRIRNKIFIGLNMALSLNGEKIIFTFKSLQYLLIIDEIFLPV